VQQPACLAVILTLGCGRIGYEADKSLVADGGEDIVDAQPPDASPLDASAADASVSPVCSFDLCVGHESEDLSEYSSQVINGGTFVVDSAAALGGSEFGIRAALGGTDSSAVGVIALPQPAPNEMRFRFHLDTATLVPDGLDPVTVFDLRDSIDSVRLANIMIIGGAQTPHSLAATIGQRTPVVDSTFIYWNDMNPGQHWFELHLVRSSAAGVADGVGSLWIDDQLMGTVPVDNFEMFGTVESVAIGVTAATSTGEVYLDELVANFNDGTMIGP
jgi:hypothetical protein